MSVDLKFDPMAAGVVLARRKIANGLPFGEYEWFARLQGGLGPLEDFGGGFPADSGVVDDVVDH